MKPDLNPKLDLKLDLNFDSDLELDLDLNPDSNLNSKATIKEDRQKPDTNAVHPIIKPIGQQMTTTQITQSTPASTAERVSRRVDEFATEVQGWRALAGEDIGFGFDTARGATHLLAADEAIMLAQHAFPDHKSIAFGLPAPDAMLLKRTAERPLKTLIPMLIAQQVNGLIAQDGRHDEFHRLWVISRNGSTTEVREAGLKELHAKSAPYYIWAQEIIQGHVEVYNPHNVRSPLHRANFG